MTKILTAFGATGNQGGSVIRSILAHPQLSKTYSIRAVTRDPSKPAAVELKKLGVEVVAADLNDAASVKAAIKGASVVFGVTNFWEKMSAELETQQGKTIVDACKEENVDRLIFSTLLNVSEVTKGRITHVAHFDAKAKIEEYARSQNVPGTYYLPAVFMTGVIQGFRKGADGTYAYSLPFPATTKMPLIDVVADTGSFVSAVLLNLDKTLNKRILGSCGNVEVGQMVRDFEEATGKKAVFNQVTYEQFHSFLPPPVATELTENFKFIEEPGYYFGEPAGAVEDSIKLVESAGFKTTSWKEFLAAHFKG
jgi:uncharacterized protein YbjT (DUF2867 family)